jgi:hypothetical protein
MTQEGNKKIRDTKVGQWLSSKSPKILDTVGDLLPDQGVLGVIKRLVDSDPDITPQEKLEFEKLKSQIEISRQENVTRRWEADMSSDVYLAKIIRPSIMIFLIVFLVVLTVWDSVSNEFSVKDTYVDLLSLLLMTTAGAYFAGRTIEKVRKK